jgi:uncharacterized protein (DUF1778 family)
MTTLRKRVRFEARIDPTIKEVIVQAAKIRGLSLTEFVIQAAHSCAVETLEVQRRLQLSKQDQALFIDTLMNPPAPNVALTQAARQSQARLGS